MFLHNQLCTKHILCKRVALGLNIVKKFLIQYPVQYSGVQLDTCLRDLQATGF